MLDLVAKHIETHSYAPTNELVDSSITFLQKERQVEKKQLPNPIDYLKKVMKERNLRNRDLKIYIGSSGNVSSVLKKKKPLSLRMIRNLNKYLDIPADILIQPYDCR